MCGASTFISIDFTRTFSHEFKFKLGKYLTLVFWHLDENDVPYFLFYFHRDVPSYGVYTAVYQLLFTTFKITIDSHTLACGLAGGFAGMVGILHLR